MFSRAYFLAATLCLLSADAFLIPRDNGTEQEQISIPLIYRGNQGYMACVQMGLGSASQRFNFTFNLNSGLTLVAGKGCDGCSSASAPEFNTTMSTTFKPPPSNAANNGTVKTVINGKTILGQIGSETCAFKNSDGDMWSYNEISVVVAEPGSDSSSIPASGIIGFGQSMVPTPTNALITQYLTTHLNVSTFFLGFSVDSISNIPVGQDTSGGSMDIFTPNQSKFTGGTATLGVASSSQQQNFGGVPDQLQSYDWTIQISGWQFTSKGTTLNGGQGAFATVEIAYPYILITQRDAQAIYATIPGAQPYTYPANAVSTDGYSVFQDPGALSWSIPCSSSLSMTWNFQGIAIPIQASDMFTSIGGVCVGNIKGWVDPNRQTYILGSSFMRNAYVSFTANLNSQSNTIGFAQRLFETKAAKSDTGAIVGGVVGGVALLAIVAGFTIFFIRKRKRDDERSPTPAAFNAQQSNAGLSSQEKSSFFSKSKPNTHEGVFVEPWYDNNNKHASVSDVGSGGVTVQPWTPNALQDQAFLSPTGQTIVSNGNNNRMSMHPQPMSPSAASTDPVSAPGSPGVDRPLSGSSYAPLAGRYSPNPNGQAMWIERS